MRSGWSCCVDVALDADGAHPLDVARRAVRSRYGSARGRWPRRSTVGDGPSGAERDRWQQTVAESSARVRNRFIVRVRPSGPPERLRNCHTILRPHGRSCGRRRAHPRQILDASYAIWHDGLTRAAYGRYYAAQVATPWGQGAPAAAGAGREGAKCWRARSCTRSTRCSTVEPIRVAGIGARVHRRRRTAAAAQPASWSSGCSSGRPATASISRCCSRRSAPDYYARLGFATIATHDLAAAA